MSMPISTSTTSRQSSPSLSSSQAPLSLHPYVLDSVMHVSSSIEDINKETLPSISTAIKNLTIRHAQEIRETTEPAQPRIGQNVK